MNEVIVTLQNSVGNKLPIYIDVIHTKWYDSLNAILQNKLHLEKNHHFLGIPRYRSGIFLTDRIAESIAELNKMDLGYQIRDRYTVMNLINDIDGEVGDGLTGRTVNYKKLDTLCKHIDNLSYSYCSNKEARWHKHQLTLLAREFKFWAESWRKMQYAPEEIIPIESFNFLNSSKITPINALQKSPEFGEVFVDYECNFAVNWGQEKLNTMCLQVGRVDLLKSFKTIDYVDIWTVLFSYLDVFSIQTDENYNEYRYSWEDTNYKEQQLECIK